MSIKARNNILSKIEEDSMEYVLNVTDDDTKSNLSEKTEETLLKRLEEKTQMKKLQKSNSRRRTRSSRWVTAIGFKRKDISPSRSLNKEEMTIEEEPEEEDEEDEKTQEGQEEDEITKKIRELVYEEEEELSLDDEPRLALTERETVDSDIKMRLIPVEITSTFVPARSKSSENSEKLPRKKYTQKNLKIMEISKKLDAIKKSSMKIRNQMDAYINTRQPRPKNTFYSPNLRRESPQTMKKDISSMSNLKKEVLKTFITPVIKSKLPNPKSTLRKSDRFSIISKNGLNKKMYSTMADTRSGYKPSMRKQLFQNISIVPSHKKKSAIFRSQEGIVRKKRKQRRNRKPVERKKPEDISIKKIIEKLSPKHNAHISYWDAKSSPKKIQKKSGLESSRFTTLTKKSQKKKKKERTYTNYFEFERSRSRKKRRVVDRGKSAASQNRSSNLFDLSCFGTVGDYSKYKLRRAGSNKSLAKKAAVRGSFEDKKRLRIKKIGGMQKSDIGEIDLSLASNDIRSRYQAKPQEKSIFRNLIKEFLETSTATTNHNINVAPNVYDSGINASNDLSDKVVNLLPEKLVEKLRSRKYYDSKAVRDSRGAQHLQPAFHSLLKSRNINLADLTKSSIKNTDRSLKRYSDKRRRHTSLNSEKNFFEMFRGKANYRPSYGYQQNYFNIKARTKSFIPKRKL